jgi:predicted ATPase
MEAMKAAVAQAQAGQGQIVATMADAGVGKSRLLFEFKATSQAGWMVLEASSASHGKASAHLPVIDLLQSYFKIAGEDDQRAWRERVAGKMSILDPSLEDARPYLFALLGIVEGEDPLAGMDPQIRKRRTLDAIKRILLRESLNQPLMVIFEDLHWVDDETQGFLNLLADSIGTSRILMLVNYRPEYFHSWGNKTYYTQLRLDPLGEETAEEMLTMLLGDGAELTSLKRLIIERTEGNPFFMEETVQSLLDEGALVRDAAAIRLTKLINSLRIPPTVQGILAARIDRLPSEAKELLQTLAVIGREFLVALVREVIDQPLDEVEKTLNELQLAEFIYEQPAVSDTGYIFKHALTQEVAYNSILIERRKKIHERVGAALEALRSDAIDEYLAELAFHYARSANHAKAIEYSSRAAERATQTFDDSGAVLLLERALELAANLSDADSRAQNELKLLISLAQAQSMRMGLGSEEVGRAYERARQLAQQFGSEAQKFTILRGLALHYDFVARLDDSRELGIEVLALAEKIGDPNALVLAHLERANAHFVRGEFSQSLKHRADGAAVFQGNWKKDERLPPTPALSRSYPGRCGSWDIRIRRRLNAMKTCTSPQTRICRTTRRWASLLLLKSRSSAAKSARPCGCRKPPSTRPSSADFRIKPRARCFNAGLCARKADNGLTVCARCALARRRSPRPARGCVAISSRRWSRRARIWD